MKYRNENIKSLVQYFKNQIGSAHQYNYHKFIFSSNWKSGNSEALKFEAIPIKKLTLINPDKNLMNISLLSILVFSISKHISFDGYLFSPLF